MKLRTGRRLDKNLYLQLDDQPSDADPLVGQMQSAELAVLVVSTIEACQESRGTVRQAWLDTGRSVLAAERAAATERLDELTRKGTS